MAGASSIGIEVKGAKAIKRALAFLGDDATYLKAAMEKVGHLAVSETRKRAPGSMATKVEFVRVSMSKKADIRALSTVKHAGAIPMEFGRHIYYAGYKRGGKGSMKKGFKVHRQGQQKKVFVGVVNQDAAIGAAKAQMAEILQEAIEKEWLRIAGGPD